MNFGITLCNNLDCSKLKFYKTKKDLTLEVCKDLIDLINDKYVDNNYLDRHILNKCIQITNSEYGFIGKVENNKLYTKSITNIAWNDASYEFYIQNKNHDMIFDIDKTVFGCSINEKSAKIINKYDNSRNILPKGHPKIKRFMGVPLLNKEKVIYFVGLCNKLKNYNRGDIKNINKILNVSSLVLFKKT